MLGSSWQTHWAESCRDAVSHIIPVELCQRQCRILMQEACPKGSQVGRPHTSLLGRTGPKWQGLHHTVWTTVSETILTWTRQMEGAPLHPLHFIPFRYWNVVGCLEYQRCFCLSIRLCSGEHEKIVSFLLDIAQLPLCRCCHLLRSQAGKNRTKAGWDAVTCYLRWHTIEYNLAPSCTTLYSFASVNC